MRTTGDTLDGRVHAEEDRIRAVYADRLTQEPERYARFEPARLFQRQDRERQVLRALERQGFSPLAGKRILEVGCGTGAWIRDLIRWGAQPEHILGIDLRPDSVAEARRLCPAAVRIECGSATELPIDDEACDLVLQATVFTSVLDMETKRRIAREMRRIVRRDGLIVWYDFLMNNPRNRDVRGIGKREIRALFPDCTITLRRTSLAPPIVRRLAPRSWLASSVLAGVPLLCTHYLGLIRKAPRAGA